jgi:hypothetical protein
MMPKRQVVILALCLGALGCATTMKNDYSSFYAHPPRSILVVPVLNDTVEVLAPNMLLTTVPVPLGERGYYIFPVLLTDALLRDLGLPEAGLIHQLPPGKFFEHFGADAVLFITIKDWSSKYIVIQNVMVIRAQFVLIDTRTGTVLWDHTQAVQQQSGSGGGGGLGGLIAMAVTAAIEKIMAESFESQYRPLAMSLSFLAITTNNVGLPAGPYHPNHGGDRSDFPASK